MLPECILLILDQDPDAPDVYKFMYPNNHSFLECLRIEFYHQQPNQSNKHIATTTKFFWEGNDAPIRDTIYRLRNAYDQEGKLSVTEVESHIGYRYSMHAFLREWLYLTRTLVLLS